MRRNQNQRIDGKTRREQMTEEEEIEDRRNEAWMTHYGDKRERQDRDDKSNARFITYNINTLPDVGTMAQDRMKHELKNNTVIGISEINKNWNKISSADSYYNRTQHWWIQPKTQVAWLRDDQWHSEFQRGGVAVTAQGQLSPFVQDKGTDAAGLGRWTWITIEGRSNTKTAIIQIYRPCRNNKGKRQRQSKRHPRRGCG